MGYILIVIGMILAIIGIIMVMKPNTHELPEIPVERPTNIAYTVQPEASDEKQETLETEVRKPETSNPKSENTQKKEVKPQELSAKEKGNAFESYIADILKGAGIRIKQWNQGTVTEGGAMGENALNPDFFVEQAYGKSTITYWLECKWRKDIHGKYAFPPSQFERYKKIQRESKRKVLIIFGIGGSPDNPASIYIVPIDSIHENAITQEEMRPYYHSDLATQLLPRMTKYFREEVFKRK